MSQTVRDLLERYARKKETAENPVEAMLDACDEMLDEMDDASDECYSCQGRGYIKRRYGTAGPGPAKITKQEPCPDCDGTGIDPSSADAEQGGDQT